MGCNAALARYRAFSASHSRAFSRALALQRLVPALPPPLLSLLLRATSVQTLVDRAFGWYLDQAHPAVVGRPSAPATHDAHVRASAHPDRRR